MQKEVLNDNSDLIITFVEIYGIQNLTHLVNVFVTGIGWADNYSWKVSWVIAPLLPQRTFVVAEPRIDTPFFAIGYMLNKMILWPQPNQHQPYLVIVGNDSVGQRFYLIYNLTSYLINIHKNTNNINIVMDFSKLYTIYYVPYYKVVMK